MGLPKIERDADADKGPYAVILAPTRELAQQVSWSIHTTCYISVTSGMGFVEKKNDKVDKENDSHCLA